MTDIDKLLRIMADLRDPETGCPWDKQQNFESILPYTIEEAYEVQEAILDENHQALCEELGDLLLQVVYHSQMAREQGLFDFQDVVNGISEKMVRRHPHVFGDTDLNEIADVKQSWQAIKQSEKRSSPDDANASDSLLNDVMRTLPALKRAQKIQSKAAYVGFDWQSSQPVFDKIEEECREIQTELDNAADKATISMELGDLLFSAVNLARKLEVDAEISLAKSTRKFIQRFSFIEKELRKQSKSPEECSLEELDQLWEQAKSAV